jgi:small subunit ribosomal protein S6
MTKNYELLLALSEDTTEADQKGLIKSLEDIIGKAKGEISQTESWGKRSLAFSIKKNKNAFYYLVDFTGEGSLPKVLSDSLRIEDKVLRFIIAERQKPVKAKKKAKTAPAKKLDELVVR